MHAIEELAQAADFTELTKYTNEFEPFRAMGIRNKELVHSRILASLLSKNERHGLGATFLNALASALASPGVSLFSGERLEGEVLSSITQPNVHSLVYRELDSIDLVVVFPALQVVIGIENKINAREQKDQISRYQETLRTRFNGFRQVLIFLTRNGRSPTTANTKDPVPVYCMSYSLVTKLLKACKTFSSISPSASVFIDQFIEHLERYMIENARIKDLCWKLFTEHEEAYRHIAEQHQNCIELKINSYFSKLSERFKTEALFSQYRSTLETLTTLEKNEKSVVHIDLDVRLNNWPKGVWIKIYKHTWFGVFPFIYEDDLQNIDSSKVPVSGSSASAWKGHRYVSAKQGLDEGRMVRQDGNSITEDDLNVALTLAADYMEELNSLFPEATVSH